jgi:hypothetical protein
MAESKSKPEWTFEVYYFLVLLALLLVGLAVLLIILFGVNKCNGNWNGNNNTVNQTSNEQQLPFQLSDADLAVLGIDNTWTLMQDHADNLNGPSASANEPSAHDEALSRQITNEQLRDVTTGNITKVKLNAIARGRGRRGPHQRVVDGTNGVKNASGSSLNWSGYAAATNINRPANGSVTQIIAQWIVPTLAPESGHTFASYWPGIDGLSNSTVEQLGTEHDWVNGEQTNYTWFEMYVYDRTTYKFYELTCCNCLYAVF